MFAFIFVSLIIKAVSCSPLEPDSDASKVQSDLILKTFDNIKKTPGDDRLYRGLELKNGIRVMLISDPKTVYSSAALTVGTGDCLVKC